MKMQIKNVFFVKSSAKIEQCPEPDRPEYAFVGRSNVGKSSLINFITQKKKLALTSENPGKTKLINHFLVDNLWYLVDLPGYGYAKVSKSERKTFEPLIKNYLTTRINLACLFLLIDIRHEPLEQDLEFLRFLGENMIAFNLVFTKADKVSEPQCKKNIETYKIKLMEEWQSLPPIFITSALKNSGREEILKFIEDTNRLLKSKSMKK
jgi:GTP-binding protein